MVKFGKIHLQELALICNGICINGYSVKRAVIVIPKEILDVFLEDHGGPDAINAPESLLKQLTKAVIQKGHTGRDD